MMTTSAALPAHQEAQLQALASALAAARAQGDVPALIRQCQAARALLPALPPAFAPVLEDISQRLESAAMFGEESCSFSLGDLYGALDTWQQRARLRLGQAL